MKQRREGWATRKFNRVRSGGVEGCVTRQSFDSAGENHILIIVIARLLSSEPWSSTAAKFTRSKEPTASSNQPLAVRSFEKDRIFRGDPHGTREAGNTARARSDFPT